MKKILAKIKEHWFLFLISVIANILGIIGFGITIFQIWPQVSKTSTEVQQIKQKLKESSEPETVLYSFFYQIEQRNLTDAYNLLSDDKKKVNSFEWFHNWLKNVVAFEWLKITPIPEKTSASQRVYLVEFDFKQRTMKPVKTKMGYTLLFDGLGWKISYSTKPLYENGWKEWACEFYNFPEHCK